MKNIFSLRYQEWIIVLSFVVHDHQIYEYLQSDRTETKIQGRRAGGSPEVLSKLVFDVSCSHLPHLFKSQNLNVMHDTKDNPTMVATDPRHGLSNELTPDRVVSNFLFCDRPEAIQETLEAWFLSFVSNELPDMGSDAHVRHANHYLWLRQLISECGQNQNRRVS